MGMKCAGMDGDGKIFGTRAKLVVETKVTM